MYINWHEKWKWELREADNNRIKFCAVDTALTCSCDIFQFHAKAGVRERECVCVYTHTVANPVPCKRSCGKYFPDRWVRL